MLSKVIQEVKTTSPGVSIEVYSNREDASRAVADEVQELIELKSQVVLGLATGSTPLPFYRELVRRHREEGLSFAAVEGFNLDEYEGLPPEHPESYYHFMQENFYGQVNAKRAHLLPGLYQDAEKACADYEAEIQAAGGVDLQILGIGGNGHIAFNEPGSGPDSRTRRIELDSRTRQDAIQQFGTLKEVPLAALTMGVGTVMESRKIVLMAWGAKKAEILEKALTGPVTNSVPASLLQNHGNVRIIADFEAGGWALD